MYPDALAWCKPLPVTHESSIFVLILQLLKYDKEVSAFYDVIQEESIHFPPR